MRSKDLLIGLCRAAGEGLEEELAGLVRAASDEIPNITNQKKVEAQWVYWIRDADAKQALASFLEKTPLDVGTIFHIAPQDKHAVLTVIVRETGLWVGLCVPPGATVDRRNLAAKLTHAWERERLLAQLSGLSGALLTLGTTSTPAEQLDDKALVSLAESLNKDPNALMIGQTVGVDVALEMGPALVEEVRERMAQTIALYRFVAWTRDNDLIDATKQLQAQKKVQRRRQAHHFARGESVRFVAGMFAGRHGVVEGVDTKSQVKVTLGKMSIVVPGADLAAAQASRS